MLKMVHPEIEAVGQTLDREQFNAVYAPRGWQLMDEPSAYANDTLGRFVRSAEDLTLDEARALISARGGEYPEAKATNAEVQKLYVDSFSADPLQPVAPVETPAGIPISQYNPGDYNAAEVIAHLEGVDEAEQARIIEVEKADKNRKTIVGWEPPAPEDDSAPAANENQE